MICSSIVDLLFFLNQVQGADIKIILCGRNKEHMINRFDGFYINKDYEFIYFDATQLSDLDCNPDYIIHGASNAHPSAYSHEPVETMMANILGLNTLLRLASTKETKRLLYISSSEVYGKKGSNQPYEENDYGFVDLLNPRACYPISKRAAETLCVSYGQEYNVSSVIARPGHIYGPTITDTDSRASAQFSRSAAKGEDIIMKSAGTQLRSYTYALDCASAILTILLNGENQQAYNISNPASICSIREMAEALAKAGNVRIIFENPSDYEKKSYNLMDNSSLNSKKLIHLGWKAAFNLELGTQRTIEILKKNQ